MGLFSRKKVTNYESDLTKFMREFLEQHPEEIESQRKGRAAWWDKTPDERAPAPSMRHAPRSGGAEHTFHPVPSGGGAEHMFAPDDNAKPEDDRSA
jgi:hypothetical protein